MRLLTAAIALTCIAAPAFAQDGGKLAVSFPDKEFGDWTIYGYDTDCWLKRELSEAGSGELSISTGKDPLFYLQLDDPDWKTIESGKEYSVTVHFGTVDLTETGNVSATTLMLITDAPEDRFLPALEAAGKFKIDTEKYGLEVPLPTDPAAYAYLRDCVAAARKL